MWEEVLLVSAAILILAHLLTRHPHGNSSKVLPGPTNWPIIGNTIEAFKHVNRSTEWFYDMTVQYGRVWTANLPMYRIIAITDPKDVEHILKTNFENFGKGPKFHEITNDLLGDGIFAVDGPAWETQRKTASHMFRSSNFKTLNHKVFTKHANHLVDMFVGHAKSGNLIDIQSFFYRLTLDSIGEIALGETIGAMDDADIAFARAFDWTQAFVYERFLNPAWRISEMFGSGRKRLQHEKKLMAEFCLKIVQRRRKEGLEGREDVLSRFISIADGAGPESLRAGVVGSKDKYLTDVIMNFMIAGRDTTAQAMTWCVKCLSENPKVEEEMVKEINRVLGDAPSPTFEQLKDMPYTKAVIKETLRLYPSVPKDIKYAFKDDTLPCGVKVPAGSFVMYMPYTMGRLESLWEEPLKFRPERFMTGTPVSPFKFVSFQAGRRVCLGMDMAYAEAGIVLATLYKRFTFKVTKDQPIEFGNSLTLPARHGLKVSVEARK